MAVYAVGDLQGCFDALQRLLDAIKFDPAADELWLAGDLVNRGPQSAEVLRFARDMGDSVKSVLGNHDLHLLATAYGVTDFSHKKDTMRSVLDAPDRDELLDWLRHQPLMHHDETLGFSMIHAGLPPQWKLKKASKLAREVEDTLRSDDIKPLLQEMYGNKPRQWSKELTGLERARFIINCFTRLRYCSSDGKLDFKQKGAVGSQPDDIMPWFEVKGRKTRDDNILFGHWSTLGTGRYGNVFSLDGGAIWGGHLTALRIDQELLTWSALDCSGLYG